MRVSEAPADGAANAAVVKLVAKALGVPRSEVEIVSGHAGRHKRLLVPLDADETRRRLTA